MGHKTHLNKFIRIKSIQSIIKIPPTFVGDPSTHFKIRHGAKTKSQEKLKKKSELNENENTTYKMYGLQ